MKSSDFPSVQSVMDALRKPARPNAPSADVTPELPNSEARSLGRLVGLLSDKELRDILLTRDGLGKTVKEQALETLLNRRFPKGVTDMPASAYLDDEPNTSDDPRAKRVGSGALLDSEPKTPEQ